MSVMMSYYSGVTNNCMNQKHQE